MLVSIRCLAVGLNCRARLWLLSRCGVHQGSGGPVYGALAKHGASTDGLCRSLAAGVAAGVGATNASALMIGVCSSLRVGKCGCRRFAREAPVPSIDAFVASVGSVLEACSTRVDYRIKNQCFSYCSKTGFMDPLISVGRSSIRFRYFFCTTDL